MTEPDTSDAAVQIAVDAISGITDLREQAEAVVSALARKYDLCPRGTLAEVAALRAERDAEIAAGVAQSEEIDQLEAEVATLRAVADAMRAYMRASYGAPVDVGVSVTRERYAVLAALDALPPATTEAVPSSEDVERGGWIAEEVRRARARTEALPRSARPVVTRPPHASRALPAGPQSERETT